MENPTSADPTSGAAAPRPPRKRPPPRQTIVSRIERLSPRVTRVVCEGPELEGFGPPKPGGHMKLFFPHDAAWSHKDLEAPRPPSRTYTPRSYDANARTLTTDFVLHGEGLAMEWLKTARAGSALYVAGPGGGYEVPGDAKDIVLLADDTAMPAAGTILEALPAGCRSIALCEVSGKAEERPLSSVSSDVRWAHLDGAQAGSVLEREVKNLRVPDDAFWWVACESNAMRRIRAYLLRERGIDPARVHTRGYWRLGEINHPDHDYGND